jgi:Zn-dependent peptidase ImmA (M78 family)
VNFEELSRKAVRAALDVRRRHAPNLAQRACPFDIADQMGISVRLMPANSLEGLYSPGSPPVIIVGSARPYGRMRYSVAHEIGHHVFGHGHKVDELIADAEQEVFDPEEYAADRFAAALLMPKLAVEAAFKGRGWVASAPSAEQVLIVSASLGVGYETLVGYLERTLRLVDRSAAVSLRRARPKRLRGLVASFDVEHDLYVLDEHMNGVLLDAIVGDVILLRQDGLDVVGPLELRRSPQVHGVAMAPGTATLSSELGNWKSIVRIGRREFDGVARYRYLEDVADG